MKGLWKGYYHPSHHLVPYHTVLRYGRRLCGGVGSSRYGLEQCSGWKMPGGPLGEIERRGRGGGEGRGGGGE